MTITIDQILQQTHQRVNLRTFYEQFTHSLCQSTDAIAAIVWRCESDGVQPIYEFLADPDVPLKLPFSEQENLNLINKAIEQKKPIVAAAKSQVGGSDELPAILASPVFRNGDIELVEVFTRPLGSKDEVKANLQTVAHYCEIASRFRVASDTTAIQERGTVADAVTEPASQNTVSSDALDQYVERLHRDIDQRETNARICNEARRILKCDRVSVIQKKRSGFEVAAISGQPSVNRRSNVVQLLRRLTRRVLPTGQAFWYPTTDEIAPQIEEPLNNYLAQSTTRTLAIIPLFDRPPADEEETSKYKNPDPSIIGGLVIEHFSQQWQKERVSAAVDVVSRHAGTAFRNAYTHRQLFLYSIWHWIGKSKVIFAARHLPKTILAFTAILAVTLFLTFFQWSFDISCEGTLIPTKRQYVYAEMDGDMNRIPVGVGHGKLVAKNDLLAELTNKEHELRLQAAVAKVARIKSQMDAIIEQRSSGRGNNAPRSGSDDYQSLESDLKTAKKEIKAIEKMGEKLLIRSPMKGTNLTWNFRERLKDRPIKAGDVICEIADTQGEWELQLLLPDRRIGHVLEYHRKHGELIVEFTPASKPNQSFFGVVQEIGMATETDSENGQTIHIKVEIDAADLDFLQANTGINAKIKCGKRSAGYVWMHDVKDWIDRTIIFPYF